MTVAIAVLNRKGGVGKTSVTKDLAYALVASGQRVLQVGLDPQSSLEVVAGLGFDTPAGAHRRARADARGVRRRRRSG